LSDNLPEVEAQLKEYVASFDARIARVASDVTMRFEQLAKEEIKGERGYSYPGGKKRGKKAERIYEKAIPGQPPMNRSGDLRRSIAGTMKRIGFGIYSAEAGAYTVYARRLELGGGNWKPGTKFPYMEPALRKLLASGYIGSTLRKHFRS
jgi:Bacteriophage HK97-gp10, putative tail-component